MSKYLSLLLLLFLLLNCNAKEKPNFIIIFADDLGYGDLGSYGNTIHRTPNLDKMAAEGVRFTDFYASSSVCTPSRASLLTGSYPRRINMDVSAMPVGTPGRQVLYPAAKKGLNPKEVTIADLLKEQGYATACIGKWHLGDQKEFLPTRQGFDYYYGIPYSNDMDQDTCPLPLMRNEQVIEAPVNQNNITRRYTSEALAFIEANKTQPFFIYLPHTMVHAPLHASENFRGKSQNGLYGDAVEELDWSTGRILDYLKSQGLAENTLVVFTSDNGASVHHGGTNAPLRGFKATTWEGGMRVPAIFWWPEHILSGHTISELATTMDLLPTLAYLSGSTLPGNIIDGHNILPLLQDEKAKLFDDKFYYYQSEQLTAVRYREWKLHLPLDSLYDNPYLGTFEYNRPAALYNLEEDIGEQIDVSKKHPKIVQQILAIAEEARTDLGDLGIEGENTRPAGIVANPLCNTIKEVNK